MVSPRSTGFLDGMKITKEHSLTGHNSASMEGLLEDRGIIPEE
jgi:hypothetical protein